MKVNILIIGMPHSGKSTLLNIIIRDYNNKVGFVTNEVLENNGSRVGFELVNHKNERSMLSHVNFKSNFKVSRYHVNIDNLNEMVARVSDFSEDDFLYLDEIGQMELFSEDFKELTLKYLNSRNVCIMTISKIYEDDFIKSIKGRDDVLLIEITEANREAKLDEVKDILKTI